MSDQIPENEFTIVCETVAQVARRSRRLVFLRALYRFLFFLLVVATLLIMLDCLLRLRSHAVLWLQFSFLLSVLAWATARIIVPAEKYQPDLVLIARRIEETFPELDQRLSTVCDLYQQVDELSRVERHFLEGLARQVSAELSSLKLDQCFRPRVLLRPVLSVLIVMGVLSIWLVVNPEQLATATQRVVMPWSGHQWPREFELRVIDFRSQAAEGGDYVLSVSNSRGKLPDDLTLEIRWFGSESSEFFRLEPSGDEAEHRLNSVRESFKFRLHGGDFQGATWYEVTVVAAPTIRTVVMTVHPPDYTNLGVYSAEQRIRALPGSSLSLEASLDEPIESAKLIWDSAGKHSTYPAIVQRHDESFRVTLKDFPVQASGLFWLEFEGDSGVVSQTREVWQVDLIDDMAPVVKVLSPGAGALVTATGLIPLKISATDDLRVEQADILVRALSGTGQQDVLRLPLQVADLLVAPRLPYDTNRVFIQQQPDSVQLEGRIDVSAFTGFAVGAELSLSVVVTDGFGNQTSSEQVGLTVRSDKELRGELTQRLKDVERQFLLLRQLLNDAGQRLLLLQKEDASPAESTALLQQLSLEGTNIQEVLASGNHSILTRLAGIREALELAQVKAPLASDSLVRLELLATTVRDDHLKPIQAGVYQARHAQAMELEDWFKELEAVEFHLASASALIDSVLGEQSSIQSKAEFETAWRNLFAEQLELKNRTMTTAAQFLVSGDVTGLGVSSLSEAQLQLATEVFQLLEQANLEGAVGLELSVRELSVSVVSAMRRVSILLRQYQFEEAQQQQEEILKRMRLVLTQQGVDPASDDSSRDRQARRLLEQLKNLHRQQKSLMEDVAGKTTENEQLYLAESSQELSQQPGLSPLLKIGLIDLSILQRRAVDLWGQDKPEVRRLQTAAVNLLESIVGVAAGELVDQQADGVRNANGKAAQLERLELVKTLQQHLHSEFNQLVNKTGFTEEEASQLKLLIQRQQQITDAMESLRIPEEMADE